VFERKYIMSLYAETPVHVGAGTVVNSVVDLPIQRERHTEFPIIQGSSLKGVLRSVAKLIGIKEKVVDEIFGTENGIGGIAVTDAKILAFPVRSLKGVFGWITCPLVLKRFRRDLKIVGERVEWGVPEPESEEKVLYADGCSLICNENDKGKIFLEDLGLTAEKDEKVKEIAKFIAGLLPEDDVYKPLKDKMCKDLVVVHDNLFKQFVKLTTEVVARIRIDPDKGTVDKSVGGLWYEEFLPCDTLMYSLLLVPKRKRETAGEVEDVIKKIDEIGILQVGGDETIGKGFMRVRIVEGGKDDKELGTEKG
jgi:CRISPR-associated protein Cmr4